MQISTKTGVVHAMLSSAPMALSYKAAWHKADVTIALNHVRYWG
jgi:hypothetical protein